ncbi:MAG TPA: hypothetical protein VFC22_04430, partial [Solirubrobacteraceae bacterium]|nr:hypothetical protein [Solirubrobacteraceae bacterium]
QAEHQDREWRRRDQQRHRVGHLLRSLRRDLADVDRPRHAPRAVDLAGNRGQVAVPATILPPPPHKHRKPTA